MKTGRIASEQELSDVMNFRMGHQIRIAPAIKNIYGLPKKWKSRKSKKAKPEPDIYAKMAKYGLFK